MCLDPGALEFLNHKTPARGGFQRECRPVVARKAREPAAQVLPGGGTDLSAKDFAGLCLCVVEGDLLPMHVESTYNVHPGPPQAPSADNNALMISGSSAFELRRLLYMSSFLSRVDFRRTFTLWLSIDDELAELVPRANNCCPGQC